MVKKNKNKEIKKSILVLMIIGFVFIILSSSGIFASYYEERTIYDGSSKDRQFGVACTQCDEKCKEFKPEPYRDSKKYDDCLWSCIEEEKNKILGIYAEGTSNCIYIDSEGRLSQPVGYLKPQSPYISPVYLLNRYDSNSGGTCYTKLRISWHVTPNGFKYYKLYLTDGGIHANYGPSELKEKYQYCAPKEWDVAVKGDIVDNTAKVFAVPTGDFKDYVKDGVEGAKYYTKKAAPYNENDNRFGVLKYLDEGINDGYVENDGRVNDCYDFNITVDRGDYGGTYSARIQSGSSDLRNSKVNTEPAVYFQNCKLPDGDGICTLKIGGVCLNKNNKENSIIPIKIGSYVNFYRGQGFINGNYSGLDIFGVRREISFLELAKVKKENYYGRGDDYPEIRSMYKNCIKMDGTLNFNDYEWVEYETKLNGVVAYKNKDEADIGEKTGKGTCSQEFYKYDKVVVEEEDSYLIDGCAINGAECGKVNLKTGNIDYGLCDKGKCLPDDRVEVTFNPDYIKKTIDERKFDPRKFGFTPFDNYDFLYALPAKSDVDGKEKQFNAKLELTDNKGEAARGANGEEIIINEGTMVYDEVRTKESFALKENFVYYKWNLDGWKDLLNLNSNIETCDLRIGAADAQNKIEYNLGIADEGWKMKKMIEVLAEGGRLRIIVDKIDIQNPENEYGFKMAKGRILISKDIDMKKSFIIYGEPGTAKTNIEFMFGKSNRESEGIFIGNAQGGDILQTPQKIAAYGGRDSYLAFKKTEPLFSIIKDFSFCVDLVEHDDTKMEGLSVNSETGDEIIPYDYNEEIAKEYKSDCSENKRKIVYFGGSRLFSEARHYSKIGGDVIFMDGQFVWGYNLGDIGGEFLHDFGHSYAYLTDTGPLDEISDVQTNARTAVNEDDKIYLFGSNDFDYGNQCKLSYYLRSTLNGGIMGKEGEVYSLVECSYILYQSEHAGWPPTGAGPLTDKLLKPYLQKCFNSYQDKILVPFTPNQEISYYDGGEEWCA